MSKKKKKKPRGEYGSRVGGERGEGYILSALFPNTLARRAGEI